MALTINLTSEQLGHELAKLAYVEIEKHIHAELSKRVQPLIDEAAREAVKLIKPAILQVNRDMMSEHVHVTLVLNNEREAG